KATTERGVLESPWPTTCTHPRRPHTRVDGESLTDESTDEMVNWFHHAALSAPQDVCGRPAGAGVLLLSGVDAAAHAYARAHRGSHPQRSRLLECASQDGRLFAGR